MSVYKKIISIPSEVLKNILGLEEDVFITGISLCLDNDSVNISCQCSKQRDDGMYEVYPGCYLPHQRWNKNAKEESNQVSRLRESTYVSDVRVEGSENCYTEEDCGAEEA